MPAENAPPLFVLVTDTYVNPARTGIQTLVRGLIAGLVQSKRPFQLVEWKPEKNGLYLLRPTINARLGKSGEKKFLPLKALLQKKNWRLAQQAKARTYRIPIHLHPEFRENIERGWLLVPELMYFGEAACVVRYAADVRLRVAAIFHDAIPISHPQLFPAETVNDHVDYMRTLANAEAVLPVSDQSSQDFIQFARDNGLRLPRQIHVCREPAEMLGVSRVTEAQDSHSEAINLLCVSTLEPRKNHATLIAAFEDFLTAYPDIDAFLHLAGARHDAAPGIAELVTDATRRTPRIRWHGRLDNPELVDRYRLADFTIYPSFLEGFGLPVVESLWLGKPCICANFGAVAESAAAGGCLMVDVRDRAALTDAITRMCTEPEMRQSLTRQAIARPLKTWRDYAGEVLEILTRHPTTN